MSDEHLIMICITAIIVACLISDGLGGGKR